MAWSSPFRAKSNFARSHAPEIACAASMGLITTRRIDGSYGHDWLITLEGLQVLHTGA